MIRTTKGSLLYEEKMKKYFLVSMVSLFLSAPMSAGTIHHIGEAIDVAGKQRMLTQRMLADYVLIGMNSHFKNPAKDLTGTIGAFDEGLAAIDAFSDNAKIHDIISRERKIWKAVKHELESAPSVEKCKMLCDELEKLLTYSNDIVQEMKQEGGISVSGIIDISGRQRMLSQRIASLYNLNLWKEGNRQFKQDLNAAMELFKKSMGRLKTYSKNTARISELIGRVEKTYHYFEMMNSMESSMSTMPSLAYKKLDDILIDMDKITHLYASLD